MKTSRPSAVNLQVVNGLGTTNGNPLNPETNDAAATHTNGLGNLIIGYNEFTNAFLPDDRTGSHNVVAGMQLDYSSYGGLVIGEYNGISAPYPAVSGGHACRATGEYASVSGGRLNVAGGNHAAVSGGAFRTAPDYDDWAAGSLFEDF